MAEQHHGNEVYFSHENLPHEPREESPNGLIYCVCVNANLGKLCKQDLNCERITGSSERSRHPEMWCKPNLARWHSEQSAT